MLFDSGEEHTYKPSSMGKMRAEGAASGDMAAAEAEATGFRSKGLTGEALRNAAEQAAQAAKGLVIDKLIFGGGSAMAQAAATAHRHGSSRHDLADDWVTEDEIKLIDDYADTKAWGLDVAEWRMWEAYVVGKDNPNPNPNPNPNSNPKP